MPLIVPAASEWNFTPTSTDDASPWSVTSGVTFGPHTEHGQVILTATAAESVPVLPLSSVARVLIADVSTPCAIHVYDHVVLAAALAMVVGCQVAPLSVEISTAAT